MRERGWESLAESSVGAHHVGERGKRRRREEFLYTYISIKIKIWLFDIRY